MANLECRDIFNAVFINVRESYISSFYSSKVKSITLNRDISEDENRHLIKEENPQGEVNLNAKITTHSDTETQRESIERMDNAEVEAKIREDIDEKFPFALASVCSNLAYLDKAYRKFKGFDEQGEFSEFVIEVSDDFPLSERFAFPAIMYVSSMMLIDIDEKRSDDFYDKYATSVSKICSELPFESKNTVEKYPY